MRSLKRNAPISTFFVDFEFYRLLVFGQGEERFGPGGRKLGVVPDERADLVYARQTVELADGAGPEGIGGDVDGYGLNGILSVVRSMADKIPCIAPRPAQRRTAPVGGCSCPVRDQANDQRSIQRSPSLS